MLTGILVTRSSLLHRSSLLRRLRPAQIVPRNRRATAVNNEPCRRGSYQRSILEQNRIPSPIPWVLPSSALGQSPERNSSTLDAAEQYGMRCASFHGITLSLAAMHAWCKHPLAPSIFWSSRNPAQSFHSSTRNHACVRDGIPVSNVPALIKQRSGASSACLPDLDVCAADSAPCHE
jgi:hypothetical protein